MIKLNYNFYLVIYNIASIYAKICYNSNIITQSN